MHNCPQCQRPGQFLAVMLVFHPDGTTSTETVYTCTHACYQRIPDPDYVGRTAIWPVEFYLVRELPTVVRLMLIQPTFNRNELRTFADRGQPTSKHEFHQFLPERRDSPPL